MTSLNYFTLGEQIKKKMNISNARASAEKFPKGAMKKTRSKIAPLSLYFISIMYENLGRTTPPCTHCRRPCSNMLIIENFNKSMKITVIKSIFNNIILCSF